MDLSQYQSILMVECDNIDKSVVLVLRYVEGPITFCESVSAPLTSEICIIIFTKRLCGELNGMCISVSNLIYLIFHVFEE